MTTLKDICNTYGLTQQALSDRFGIPLRSIENWAGGRRQPPEYLLDMMVEILSKERTKDIMTVKLFKVIAENNISFGDPYRYYLDKPCSGEGTGVIDIEELTVKLPSGHTVGETEFGDHFIYGPDGKYSPIVDKNGKPAIWIGRSLTRLLTAEQ